MSFLLRNLLKQAALKLAQNPELREKTIQTARSLAENGADQVKKIIHDEDPSRAAGRAVKSVINKALKK
jgi:hypothetical protein